MSNPTELPDDDRMPAVSAAVRAIHDAAYPLQEVAAHPLIAGARPDAMAVWAVGLGQVLTVAETRTLASAFDLLTLALMPPATKTIQ